ncbi:MAG: hypothetical protein KAT93_00675 [Desulfuromonadales bacterium]|jgi:hypothetical protein|nr:hypothetical protein [Desulfuromonadales bacterium]
MMLRYLALLVLLVMFALPATAKQKNGEPAPANAVSESVESGHFSAAERHIIRTGILQGQSRQKTPSASQTLPRGIKKKGTHGKRLPPGWQKKVAPGKRLDYQVYRSGIPLSGEILKRLPPAPVGTKMIQVENTILRLHTETRIVLDTFDLLQN